MAEEDRRLFHNDQFLLEVFTQQLCVLRPRTNQESPVPVYRLFRVLLYEYPIRESILQRGTYSLLWGFIEVAVRETTPLQNIWEQPKAKRSIGQPSLLRWRSVPICSNIPPWWAALNCRGLWETEASLSIVCGKDRSGRLCLLFNFDSTHEMCALSEPEVSAAVIIRDNFTDRSDSWN